MFNFFIDKSDIIDGVINITGNDYNHIKNVLRMRVGDTFLVSNDGKADLCEIIEFSDSEVKAKIIDENYLNSALPVKIYLFQGLPKSDKMELIIQKAVELGAEEIIPVEMNRCVVKIEEKKKKEKTNRWQAIAESAAKQSKRTLIPTVSAPIPYKLALERAKKLDVILLPYENKDGAKSLKDALSTVKAGDSVGIFIGSEGGFDEKEVALAEEIGAKTVSLGKRILRTETAAILSVGAVMLYAEINL